jgi:hypothetical protein
MRPALLFAAALVATVLSPAAEASAQTIELRGRGDVDNDILLRRVLSRGDYVLLTRDTLIAGNDTVHGTMLVVGSRLRLEGVVTGDLVAVDANVFLRPTARVLGQVRNLGGGLYPSELAVVAGGVVSDPTAPYVARELDDGTLVIQGLARRSTLVTDGFYGVRAPTYDRVDGVTVSAGAGYLLPRLGRVEPMVRGRIDYRSQRGALTGGARLLLPRRANELVIGAERTTLTNERWIIGDLENSVTFLFAGNDYRDYYEVDRAYAELRRSSGTGTRAWSAFVRGQLEEAQTLSAGTPWTVLGTPRSDNIVVSEDRISSLSAGAQLDWAVPVHAGRIAGSVEAAGMRAGGLHSFNRYEADIAVAMAGFRHHTLQITAHAQGPLPGTDHLPGQRWSFVGGSNTLETFEIAEFRGDRVVFVDTRYIIPVPRLRVRFLGRPDFELLHATGMAWTADEEPPLEQNVGVRVRFPLFNVRAMLDPTRSLRSTRFSIGANLPRRPFPWEPD